MTYDERVNSLSEKLAQETSNKLCEMDGLANKWKRAKKRGKDRFIEIHKHAAIVAIAEMAQALIIYAYQSKENYEDVLYNCPQACEDFHKHLKEQGLMPD